MNKKLYNKDKIGYAEIIHIIFDNRCITEYLDYDKCLSTKFKYIMEKCIDNGYDIKKSSTIFLICESPLDGTIYQYGNYGKFWVEHGKTFGYA